jgi:hypothetical protein
MRIDLDKWVCGLIYLWVYNGTGFVDYGFDFVVLVWWEEGGDGRWKWVGLVPGCHLGVLDNIIKNKWKNNIIIK